MGRDRVCLPFHFLLTSAQGHLKKASFSRKAGMQGQELHFLKKLEVLVSSTIPSHPRYAENRSDKRVVEFEKQLEDTRKRIAELEVEPQQEQPSRVVPKLQSKLTAKPKTDISSAKDGVSKQREAPESETDSETSSLRSKLAESVKLLSPAYSPRRLEKSLKAAARGSCLEQEASLRGKEWLKLKIDSLPEEDSETDDELQGFEQEWNTKLEVSPRKTNETSEVTNVSKDLTDGDGVDPSRAAMKSLYKQLLGAGSSGKLVQEFRQTLNALERLVDKDRGKDNNVAVQLVKEELATFYKHDVKASKAGKAGDVDFVRGFIASTRALLNARANQGDKHSENMKVVPQNRDTFLESAMKKDKDRREGRDNTLKRVRMKANRDGKDEKDRETKADHVKLHESSSDVYSFVEEKIDRILSERLTALVLGTEQALSCIRNELVTARDVGVQLKAETDSLKKLSGSKFEEFHQTLLKLQKEGVDMRSQVHSLGRLEESLRSDRENIRRLYELVDKDDSARKHELEAIRKEQEELCARMLIEGETEKAVIMDRIERLSQLYIGGLEEVRAEVISLKTGPDSTARAESLLAEMRNRRKKSMQLESVMKNAVEAALKLQEKYSLELEKAKDNWNWAMNLQIGETKAVLGELTEQSQSLSSQLNSVEGHNVLLSRIQNIEGEVRQLMATVQSPLNEAAFHENIAKHKDVIQKELNRLDEQMQDALKKLENAQDSLDHESLRADLEEKLGEVTKSRALILEKINEMGKKVRKLEGAQLNLVRSVEELRTSTSDLEMSASTWLPKYETAASLLKNMDSRLGVAEGLIKGIEQGHAEVKSKIGAGEGDLQTKLETLASETLSELRLLDSKVEQCKTGVQSALEGAANAESKCGVLGAEIVKVFRMVAARNGKLTDLPEPRKEKAHSGCRSCKRATGESMELTPSKTSRGVLSHDDYYKQRERQNKSSSTFLDNYAENQYETRRGGSTRRKDEHSSDDAEERMPNSPHKRKTKEKQSVCQRTNIRLEAGKVICA